MVVEGRIESGKKLHYGGFGSSWDVVRKMLASCLL